MKLEKLIVIFLTLFVSMCWSKMMININEPDGLAELEEAAIQILTTCYANQTKTVVLIGEFPGNFIRRLSSQRSISVALVDPRRRAENNVHHWVVYHDQLDWNKRYISSIHNVHIAVVMASYHKRFAQMLRAFDRSPYFNRVATVLAIGWSSVNKYAGCDEKSQIHQFIYRAVWNEIMDEKLLCRNRRNVIVLYDANPFINQAPEPWKSVNMTGISPSHYHYFVREYKKHEGMCENIDYDKALDLSGKVIKTLEICSRKKCRILSNEQYRTRLERIEAGRRRTFIANFISYVNATRRYVWKRARKGEILINTDYAIITRPAHLNGLIGCSTYTYPHGQECKFLVSQFRGNKSQLEKIISTIDNYSWIGMGMVYVITWLFFKFFMHQPLLVGIFNLFRLTCNSSLVSLPSGVSSRIYLGCLLFFVLTMQGIFVGNLASLLTHDIPVRQVNTMKDLIDLGYTVYAQRRDFPYFTDEGFTGRLIEYVPNEDCIQYIKHDPLAACLTWAAENRVQALKYRLYISPYCFVIEYVLNILPWKWFLESAIDKYVKMTLGADIMLELNELVDEKRFLEAEAQEVIEEPEIMTLGELGFAFVILGIGLVCSSTWFFIEIIIQRFHRRVTRTRVIVLN